MDADWGLRYDVASKFGASGTHGDDLDTSGRTDDADADDDDALMDIELDLVPAMSGGYEGDRSAAIDTDLAAALRYGAGAEAEEPEAEEEAVTTVRHPMTKFYVYANVDFSFFWGGLLVGGRSVRAHCLVPHHYHATVWDWHDTARLTLASAHAHSMLVGTCNQNLVQFFVSALILILDPPFFFFSFSSQDVLCLAHRAACVHLRTLDVPRRLPGRHRRGGRRGARSLARVQDDRAQPALLADRNRHDLAVRS